MATLLIFVHRIMFNGHRLPILAIIGKCSVGHCAILSPEQFNPMRTHHAYQVELIRKKVWELHSSNISAEVNSSNYVAVYSIGTKRDDLKQRRSFEYFFGVF